MGKPTLAKLLIRNIIRIMKIVTSKTKATLMLDTSVYEAIKARVGARGVGAYLSKLAQPELARADYSDDIDAGYRAMAADEEREREAAEWVSGATEEIVGDNNWPFETPKAWR